MEARGHALGLSIPSFFLVSGFISGHTCGKLTDGGLGTLVRSRCESRRAGSGGGSLLESRSGIEQGNGLGTCPVGKPFAAFHLGELESFYGKTGIRATCGVRAL